MGRRARLTHEAVQYWEAKAKLDLGVHAVRAMDRAMSDEDGELCNHSTRARGFYEERIFPP
jgi:hypothetical protein